jgi:hypothetical protein
MRVPAQSLSAVLVLTLTVASQAFAAEPSLVGKAVADVSAASLRASGGAARVIARTGKTTSAAAVAPRTIYIGAALASAGAASAAGRQGLANNATAAPLGRMLEISEEAIALALDLNAAAAQPLTKVAEVATGFSSASSQAGEEAHFSPEQIIKFAKKVEKTMAAQGAHVAILARMGRPASELPEGMHFTHVAFAVYSEITTADGRKVPGYAIYNLYQKDDRPDVSDLVQDFPVDFFGGVAQLEAGIIVPSPDLQKRLLDVIASPTYASLHEPHYSVIANPFSLGRQNCTEFVLDVTNAALYQTADIKKIKAIETANFDAQKVNVSPLKVILGSMFTREVSSSDHSSAPVTATFETIGAYLKRYDTGSEVTIIHPDV